MNYALDPLQVDAVKHIDEVFEDMKVIFAPV